MLNLEDAEYLVLHRSAVAFEVSYCRKCCGISVNVNVNLSFQKWSVWTPGVLCRWKKMMMNECERMLMCMWLKVMWMVMNVNLNECECKWCEIDVKGCEIMWMNCMVMECE